jgi:hypothetical protein
VGELVSGCGRICGIRKRAQADGYVGAGVLHVEVFNKRLPCFSNGLSFGADVCFGFSMGAGSGRWLMSALSGGSMVHCISPSDDAWQRHRFTCLGERCPS